MFKLTLTLFLSLAVFTFTTHSSARPPLSTFPEGEAASYFQRLAGKWQGNLEYADYKDDKRVTLPTILEVHPQSEGDAAEFLFTYDDFGKTVTEKDAHRVDRSSGQYLIDNDKYEISGLDLFNKTGKLVLSGRGEENNQPVEVRETIKLEGETLTILRETRTPLRFRHQYVLHRVGIAGEKAKP